MPITKIGPKGSNKTNLAKILKEKQRAERMAKIASEQARIEAQKAAEEARLDEIIKKAAQSIYPSRTYVSIYNSVPASSSLSERILEYRDILSRSTGDWAPWSPSFKKV